MGLLQIESNMDRVHLEKGVFTQRNEILQERERDREGGKKVWYATAL